MGRNTATDFAGQLGLNDAVSRSSPTQIPGTTWSNTEGKYDAGVNYSITDRTK